MLSYDQQLPRFHLAFHVTNLDQARHFYGRVMGATEGRSTKTWVDFDFFGHQISLHLGTPFSASTTGIVGDHIVPMPHFGIVLPLDQWQELADRLSLAKVEFVIPPSVRFVGQAGEQHILFLKDPSGNAIEAKGFKDFAGVFAT